MTMADCIVAEQMLKNDEYVMMSADEVRAYGRVTDTPEDLLRKLVADKKLRLPHTTVPDQNKF